MKYAYSAGLVMLVFLLFITPACQSGTNEKTEESTTAVIDTSAYVQQGKAIAQATFAELSGKLSSALQRGGVAEAIQYCKLVAMPLVDSLSAVHGAQIRRTSLKVRNPADAPTDRERRVLEQYQDLTAQGKTLTPVIEQLHTGEIAFYAPIHIKPLCLNCHGTVGQEVAESDYAVIRENYPEDSATGYALNDLRGMWSITFQKK